MSKKILKRNNIPSAHAPNSLAVTDGTTFIGHVVVRDGSYFAFGTDDILFSKFTTQRDAMRALPAANTNHTGK